MDWRGRGEMGWVGGWGCRWGLVGCWVVGWWWLNGGWWDGGGLVVCRW